MIDKRNIFLAPRSNETAYKNLNSTIKNGVEYDKIKDLLTPEGRETLSKQNKIYAWGCASGLKSRWDKMEKGDYVLFYIKGVFRYVGQIVFKQFSDELSDALWPRKDKPWSCVFFLTDIKQIYIPLKIINELADYKLNRLQGFTVLNKKGNDAIYLKYGDPTKFFSIEFPRLKLVEELELPPANFEAIFNNIANISEPKSHDLHPERLVKIRDIISKAEEEWVLPKFQRYYDWSKNDIRDLLESIFYDYYIGSILIWQIKDTPEIKTTNIEGVENENSRRTDIILDGQQRITSLYYAIKTPDFVLKGAEEQVFFYIDFNSFISGVQGDSMIRVLNNRYSDQETFELMLFPIYRMERYTDWIDGCEDYLEKEKEFDSYKVKILRRFIERKLRHFWDDYEIPIIQLPETLELENIADIFERINSRGKPLTSFDLLIARLWKYEIPLKSIWDGTLAKHANIKRYNKQYSEKIPLAIFQSMSLYYNKTNSVRKKDILNIYENVFMSNPDLKFELVWNDISDYVNRAIERLELIRGFGVKDQKVLPFLPTIPLLAALLKETEKVEKQKDANRKIEIWYWSAVFSNAYSSAVESKLAQDFKEMQKWIDDDSLIPETILVARKKVEILDLRKTRSFSNAVYRGVLSLIGLEGAMDFDTNLNYEHARINHRDHIFPKAGFDEEEDINSILNITWMSQETNTKIKKAKIPSIYIGEFRNAFASEEEFLKVMESHLISRDALDAMESNDFEKFIVAREKTILSKIYDKIGLDYKEREYTQIAPSTPFDNKMAIIKAIEKCQDHIYWIDKYFSKEGLALLREYLDYENVSNIKILTSNKVVNDGFKSLSKDLIRQLKENGIELEVRIMDKNVYGAIHDRYIVTKNHVFNIPSPDIIKRGQFSDITEVDKILPFAEWWDSGFDLIRDGERIQRIINENAR